MTKGELALLVLAAGVFAVWLAHAAVFPYVRCRVCKGSGVIGGGGRTYRVCPACGGQRRLRLAARWVRPGLARRQR